MHIVKRINHNAAICLDSKGREVVALGSGIGFPGSGDEVDLSRVERTFYGLDDRYLALVEELPADVLEFAAQMADVIRGALPYDIIPSYPLVLADHIAFMLKRMREHVVVAMPLAYDMAQLYPLEWRLGTFVVERAEIFFNIHLKHSEVAGIVIGILGAADDSSVHDQPSDDAVLERVTSEVETRLEITIDREGMNYARFATHLFYLLRGARRDDASTEQNGLMLDSLKESVPDIVACAQEIAAHIEREAGVHLGISEMLYLVIHINRLYNAAREKGGPS